MVVMPPENAAKMLTDISPDCIHLAHDMCNSPNEKNDISGWANGLDATGWCPWLPLAWASGQESRDSLHDTAHQRPPASACRCVGMGGCWPMGLPSLPFSKFAA